MPSIFRPYGNPFSASPAARISFVLHSSFPRLCVFYQRALPWSITKVQDFFIDPHCICWHLLAAALLSLRLSRTATAIAIAIALIFLLHLLQELLPLHIPLSGTDRHVYVCSFCISLHFLQPEFFPQKWQLTLAFNRTDLLLVRFRISVPPRIAIVVRLFVRRLKASCNCRLYYHRTGTGHCYVYRWSTGWRAWWLRFPPSPPAAHQVQTFQAFPFPFPTLCGYPKIGAKKIRIQLKWQDLCGLFTWAGFQFEILTVFLSKMELHLKSGYSGS